MELKKVLLTAVAVATMGVAAQAQGGYVEQPLSTVKNSVAYGDSLGNIHFNAELDIEDIPLIQMAAKQLVEDFNTNLGHLWHKWTREELRDYPNPQERASIKDQYESATLDLFVARAEKYFTTEESKYLIFVDDNANQYYYKDGNIHRARNPQWIGDALREVVNENVEHRRAIIELTNRYRKSVTQREVIRYLNNVKNSNNYSQVWFSAGGYNISNLRKKANGEYEGTICYHQSFTGRRSDGGVYHDDTYRCITYHVKAIVKHSRTGEVSVYWDIKLGDVEAIETT